MNEGLVMTMFLVIVTSAVWAIAWEFEEMRARLAIARVSPLVVNKGLVLTMFLAISDTRAGALDRLPRCCRAR